MARSSLTKRFFTYTVGQYEKKTGKTILDALDIGNLEITKIIEIIKLGNKDISDEDAYALLDDYLRENEDNSIITAFLDLVGDIDTDLKILKSCGIKIDDIKKQFEDEINSAVSSGLFDNKENKDDNTENIDGAEIVSI